jgi:hypothetical protein
MYGGAGFFSRRKTRTHFVRQRHAAASDAAAHGITPCSIPFSREDIVMVDKVRYEILRHDGGWAYRVGETYSEAFRSHDAALEAARRAAQEQIAPGEATPISYEDEQGHWHDEIAAGDDRPDTEVAG